MLSKAPDEDCEELDEVPQETEDYDQTQPSTPASKYEVKTNKNTIVDAYLKAETMEELIDRIFPTSKRSNSQRSKYMQEIIDEAENESAMTSLSEEEIAKKKYKIEANKKITHFLFRCWFRLVYIGSLMLICFSAVDTNSYRLTEQLIGTYVSSLSTQVILNENILFEHFKFIKNGYLISILFLKECLPDATLVVN